jgi:predicted aspartyl protease/tetratricopeptide (TPR) repeat protein
MIRFLQTAAFACLGLAGLIPSPALAASCSVNRIAELPVTMQGRRASVPARVNGRDTTFWLDSGAFFSVMSAAKAAEFGLRLEDPPFGLRLVGIGGSSQTHVVTIKDFGLAGQALHGLQFLVGGSDAGNGLIGRNILAIRDTEFDIAHGSVKLFDVKGCNDKAMTYWAPGQPYFTVPLLTPADHSKQFRIKVRINGIGVDAEMDSGSPATMLSRRAAIRAGIALTGPGVQGGQSFGGFGRKVYGGFNVPVASVAIGDEEILKTRLQVIDGEITSGADSPEMLLGMDFFLAHHIFVARGQNRVYFTYNGGNVFDAAREFQSPVRTVAEAAAATASPAPAAEPALPPGRVRVSGYEDPTNTPKTADEFARRGAARLATRDAAGAVADYDAALRLGGDTAAPAQRGEWYRQRARAHAMAGQRAEATADFHQALALAPDDPQLLLASAQRKLALNDRDGALADADRALRILPAGSLPTREVAQVFDAAGEAARAVPVLTAIIDLHRDDSKLGGLLQQRCQARALANVELDKALGDCNAAIRREGETPLALTMRALVQLRRGDSAAALADTGKALTASPRMAAALWLRGSARIAAGQAEAGNADHAAARLMNPQFPQLLARYHVDP